MTESTGARLGGEGRRLVELVGLCGLAIARPVYAGFGAEPAQFLLRGAGRWAIVAFALLVAIGPPVVIWGIGYVAGFVSRSVRKWAHHISVGSLLILLLIELFGVGQLLTTGVGVVAVLVVGAVVGRGLGSRANATLWLRYLSVAAPVFCLQFLMFSPVSALVLPSGTAAAASESRGGPSVEAHLVMVVLDELPTASLLDGSDRIDADRFPNFSRLVDSGTFYRNHSTVADNTIDSLPALLTGIRPGTDRLAPASIAHPDSIFTELGATHDVEATETLTSICPDRLCPSTASQVGAVQTLVQDAVTFFRQHLERTPQGFSVAPRGQDVTRQFDGFIDSLPSASDPPSVRFLHVLTPHNPWETLADGRHYEAPKMSDADLDEEGRWRDAYAPARFRARHLQKLQDADVLLGRVLDELDQLGAWDDTMLVVVADHGIGFTAGQRPRPVSAANEAEMLWAPLFVKMPGQSRGEVADTPVESIDVVPMIAEGLGIDLSYEADGVLPRERGAADGRSYVVDGKERPLDGDAGFAAMLELAPAAADDGELGMWRGGPELNRTIGDELDGFDLITVDPDAWSAVVPGRERFAVVEASADHPPISVVGAVRRGSGAGPPIEPGDMAVVAVNGRIAGWSTLAPAAGDPLRFAVIIPPSMLVNGVNEVTVGVRDFHSGAIEVLAVT